MNEFGLPPSKRLGDLMSQLKASVDAGDAKPQQSAEYYIAYLTANRDAFGLD